MEGRQHRAPGLATIEARAHRLDGGAAHDDEAHSVALTHEPDYACGRGRHRLHDGLQHRGDEIVALGAERRALHHEHQGLAPALGAHAAHAGDRHLARQLRDHALEAGLANRRLAASFPIVAFAAAVGGEAQRDAVTHRLAHVVGELGGLVFAGGATELDERLRWDHHAVGRTVEVDVPKREIERDGLGGIERTVRHRDGCRVWAPKVSITRRNRPRWSPTGLAGHVLAVGLTTLATPVGANEPALELVERPRAQRLGCTPQICVHADGPAGLARADEALASAETALGRLQALRMPAPLSDGGAGGTLALDLYLVAGSGAAAFPDLPAPGPFARGSAFAIVGVGPGPACGLASDVARAVAQASLLGLDHAIHDGILAMQSTYLASLVSPCEPLELAAIDAAQRRPERAITDAPRDLPSGAMLFPWLLDVDYGRGAPASVMNALLAIAVDPRPDRPSLSDNEPDLFDALREVLPVRGHQLGDLLSAHAVARAFVGSRSDEAHLPQSSWLGDMGRVRFEWSIDHRSLPRRVAPRRPLDPTGSAYVWLDLSEGARAGVRVIADWETQHVFEWSFVKIDAEGRTIAAQRAGGIYGSDHADVTLSDLGEAAGLLIVATHVGSDDRSRPFDPDRGPPEPASFELTLHPE
jgi:hypothetical protein